jgi:hypothetical protein
MPAATAGAATAASFDVAAASGLMIPLLLPLLALLLLLLLLPLLLLLLPVGCAAC